MVRKSVKAIGQVAIKIADAADQCVAVLLELIGTRISYVVQEAVVVMKVRPRAPAARACPPELTLAIPRRSPQDIFRKYPFSYEGVIPTLCSNLEELEEPEAKASLIWILGEYAEKIDNADDLLGAFLKTFKEESYQVRVHCARGVACLPACSLRSISLTCIPPSPYIARSHP